MLANRMNRSSAASGIPLSTCPSFESYCSQCERASPTTNTPMCIIFFKFDPRPASKNAYRLILAANRDEFYNRPTKAADFWVSNSEILSALWCGQPNASPGACCLFSMTSTTLGVKGRPRRSLRTSVTQAIDFTRLLSIYGVSTGASVPRPRQKNCFYYRAIRQFYYCFNPFLPNFVVSNCQPHQCVRGNTVHLATVSACTAPVRHRSRRAKEDTMCYYGNRGNTEPIHLNPAGIYGLSNSLLETPWRKLQHGKRLFTSVVNQPLPCDVLVHDLLNVLNNEELNTPDPVQESQGEGYSSPMLRVLSSVCVRSPHYGTRTNTIILIDSSGNVTFTERTMLNCDISQWSTSSFQFKLKD
ncbi:transport and Golgi organization 2 homolog [Salvelinus alpinus]|uniref:transport and Golgi organization 2 homolog n=1 Tax=Salvelinus alpinus TaxID=8036 RepID=UPI0039FCF0E5